VTGSENPGEEQISLTVEAQCGGWRLDAYLAHKLPQQSRAFWQKLIDEGRVLAGGRSQRPAYRLKAGEQLVLSIPPPRPAEPRPQALELSVIFEDRHLLVLDKPAGLVVHPAPGNPEGTLVNALLYHCRDLSGIGGVLRPGIVHRLDRETSGVMLVTKSDEAHRRLAEAFSSRQVQKTYLAFAVRRPDARPLGERGRFDTLFGRHPVHRKRFSSLVESGRQAVTEWEVERRFVLRGWEIIKARIRPRTGRTHQIRVHFADHGHPLLGDKLYGGRTVRSLPRELIPARQALHAWEIIFAHPISGEPMCFHAPLAGDLVELERRLEQLCENSLG
jgi:23S rRNA pseudouridine1911/1915/1917 synthase